MTFPRRFVFALFLFLCSLLHAQTPIDITADLTFTSIDVPGAGFVGAEGINTAGDIVGYYGKTNNGPFRSFLLSGGNFTFFNYPGGKSTVATGINDSGLIVGYVGNLTVRGFLFDGSTFTSTIQHGSDSATFTIGINNAGDLVGGAGTVGSTKGFELQNGHFQTVGPNNGQYVYVYATGINNLGEVVGWTDYDGFACRQGKCHLIDFPGATQTEVWRINDSGVIVGWYCVYGPACYGFALKSGKFLSFGYPGAKGTLAKGINASGQVVGEYTYDFQIYHGFVTSPITPADF
jgi:uncharacterized membrane protein